jgi:hypothetical protein
MPATAAAPTAYEAALAAVPNAKRITLPAAKSSPIRKGTGKRKPRNILQDTADKMAQEGKARTAAIKAGKLTKAEKARGAGNGSGPVARLTHEWPSKTGRDVQVKDQVRTPDGVTIAIIGRWTKRKGDQLIPMVTGRVVSGGGTGNRKNAVAAEVTHVKK